jgi:hypothetical protein
MIDFPRMSKGTMLPGGGRRILDLVPLRRAKKGFPGPRTQALAGEGVRRKRGGWKKGKKEEEKGMEEEGGARGLFLTLPGA